jgi:hypothetical protein
MMHELIMLDTEHIIASITIEYLLVLLQEWHTLFYQVLIKGQEGKEGGSEQLTSRLHQSHGFPLCDGYLLRHLLEQWGVARGWVGLDCLAEIVEKFQLLAFGIDVVLKNLWSKLHFNDKETEEFLV